MPWDIWLIFFVLGVVVPWRGRYRLRELLAKPSVSSAERISLYASTMAFQWIAVAFVAWRAWAHGFGAAQLGLSTPRASTPIAAAIAGSGIVATLQWFNLRRIGRMPEKARERLQALAERILPQSPRERVPFFALAVTAGICEEFLYRGFAMAALAGAGLPSWSVVVISAVLFGAAHLYQGRGGLVGTILLGLIFGVARVAFDSLIPVMAWHTAVDIVAGVAAPRYLIHNKRVTDWTEDTQPLERR
jgi:membrane protease YdiL (CAAX protease family)